MSLELYAGLALQNLKRSAKFYLPYILACSCCCAMFYIMSFLALNSGMRDMAGGAILASILGLGGWVIRLFSVIFLFYTNSFLMKRRRREMGLYNILGMEKRHIAKILCVETVYCYVFTAVFGLGLGILFSKLVMMLACRILRAEIPIGFEIQTQSLVNTLVLFAVIFALILLNNLRRLHLSRPIELLRSASEGEREPRAKLLTALLGLVCLGAGYVIAITTDSPLQALGMFFFAVILVIIGTYCLFSSLSIALLKALKRSKGYYYRTDHFISVSGLIYRMKQNAVGLGNICILSTMVLVMVSSTLTLYIGEEDLLHRRYPADIIARAGVTESGAVDMDGVCAQLAELTERAGLGADSVSCREYVDFLALHGEGGFYLPDNEDDTYYLEQASEVVCITESEYARFSGEVLGLKEGEIAYYTRFEALPQSLSLFGSEVRSACRVDSFPTVGDYDAELSETYYIVVPDGGTLDRLYKTQLERYGANASQITVQAELNVDASDEDTEELFRSLDMKNVFAAHTDGAEAKITNVSANCLQTESRDFYSIFGGLFFLGLFLTLLFLCATVLIMYYKQISEGFEDKAGYEIMRSVGLSRSEIKSSVRSQVLIMFFLPLATAALHMAMAFRMITRLLIMFQLTNVRLFALCTAGTILVFALFYSVAYAVTARAYYRIVK